MLNPITNKNQSKTKFELFQKSPMVRGVKVWEMMPIAVQKATTKVRFKAYISKSVDDNVEDNVHITLLYYLDVTL